MEKLKNLSSCKDFNLLEKNFSQDMLEVFENHIAEYEDNTTKIDDCSILNTDNHIIISWYEGLITTQDLVDYYN